MINDTTRRFPRTLNEAFPQGAEYGCAITHYRNHMSRLNLWILLCSGALVLTWLFA